MPGPYLPVLSLNTSQSVRLGQGAGNSVPISLDLGDTPSSPQNNQLTHAFYADLGQSIVRRDLQRHTTMGSVLPISGLTNAHWSDLFASSGTPVSAGTGLTVNVAALTVSSRLFGGSIVTPAVSGLSLPVKTGDVYYLVYTDSKGNVAAAPGAPAPASGVVYEVDKVAITGTPTGGTFTLSFTWQGYNYTTSSIAYNASAATVATDVLGATSTNGGPSLPASTITGSGGALPGAAVTLTASGVLEGGFSGLSANGAALTGGTPAITFTQTTPGQGATKPAFGGAVLPLAFVLVPASATSSSNYTIANVALTS